MSENLNNFDFSDENKQIAVGILKKYPVDKKRDFEALLQDFPFRLFRHSKYVIGMDTVPMFPRYG